MSAHHGQPNGGTAPSYLTVRDAARMVSASEKTIRRLVASRELASGRLGKRGAIRIPRVALENLLNPIRPSEPPTAQTDFITNQLGRRP